MSHLNSLSQNEAVTPEDNAGYINEDQEIQRMRCMKHDIIALVLAIAIFLLVVILALVSFLPALNAPALPDFADPIKGFEPRGTVLSDRLNSIRLFNKLGSLTLTQIKPKASQRSVSSLVRKKRRTSIGTYCPPPRIRLIFESSSGNNLLTAENIKSMCHLEKMIMKSAPPQYYSFYHGNNPQACKSMSLGRYIAEFKKKTACEEITNQDVNDGLQILQKCSRYFAQGLLTESCTCRNLSNEFSLGCSTVPCMCSYKGAIYNILNQLTDSEFLKTPSQTNLKYSMVLSPISTDSFDLFKYIYEKHLKDSFPGYKGVKVAAFDFWNFRFDLFNILLIDNAKYPAIAMVFVLLIMCFFLKSIILSFCAILTIIFALVLSYFLYKVVFQITFFPFLNVVTLVFLVGIGADDAFVYYDIFRQTKAANPNAGVVTLTLKTLRYAALSMFVTSFTTSAAFFANLSSQITCIKLFGVYAGLSILTNYLLMVTWFPLIVLLHERWVRKRKIDQIPKEQRPTVQPVSKEIDNRDGKGDAQSPSLSVDSSSSEDANDRSLACRICWGIDFPCHFISNYNAFFSNISQKLFENWLPYAVLKKRLHFLWIFLFVGLTIGFVCVCVVSPGLQLPSSKRFQVFLSSSTIEQYNLHIREKFRYASQSKGGMYVQLMWGLKAQDNGNHLNPDDRGKLVFDDAFDIDFDSETQKWMLSICKSLSSQSFFDNSTSWAGGSLCAMQDIIQSKCAPSNLSFPYPEAVIQKCLSNVYSPQIYYDRISGKPRVMGVYFLSNVTWTAEFQKMDHFWNQLLDWSNKQFSSAPSNLKNGWVIGKDLDTYSLQYSLQQGTTSSMGIAIAIALGVMLLTTLNVFISLYAIITIIGILAITVGVLVLIGWQLKVLESIVMSVSVGLSIDFTMHYGVAYRLAPSKHDRKERVRYSLMHIGSAILMAAVTTFVTGVLMMPSVVLVYIQLGQFLMSVMVFSWVYATFAFLSLCAVIGPVGNFGQCSITNVCRKIGLCKVKPEESTIIKNNIAVDAEIKPSLENTGTDDDSVRESHL